MLKNRIVLGTAKIGMPDYGFSSESRHASHNRLFDAAIKLGVLTLDTSPRYGDAEELIGTFHKESKRKFLISTKVDGLTPCDNSSERIIFDSVVDSINKTRVSCIEELYLHQNELGIISDKRIISSLLKLKDEGLVKKIGVSIYSFEECKFAIDSGVYDVIQMPISIMDTNIYSRLIEKEFSPKIDIVARSVFLQGVLFNSKKAGNRIKQTYSIDFYLNSMLNLAKKYKINLLDLACAFALNLPNVSKIIVGTSSIDNLNKIINSVETPMTPSIVSDVRRMSDVYKAWGNPRNW